MRVVCVCVCVCGESKERGIDCVKNALFSTAQRMTISRLQAKKCFSYLVNYVKKVLLRFQHSLAKHKINIDQITRNLAAK